MIQIILVLIIVGVLLWLVHNVIPMDARIMKVIDVVVILLVLLWVVNFFIPLGGMFSSPRLR